MAGCGRLTRVCSQADASQSAYIRRKPWDKRFGETLVCTSKGKTLWVFFYADETLDLSPRSPLRSGRRRTDVRRTSCALLSARKPWDKRFGETLVCTSKGKIFWSFSCGVFREFFPAVAGIEKLYLGDK